MVLLPLVMPPVSTGLILLEIFGRRSPLGGWLYNRGVEIVFNWKGVLIAMAVMSFPLLVRAARTSFSEVNPRLEQIAATLGASRCRIFFVITIPLAFRGIIAGSLLAFSRALGEFGATILLAGNIPGRTQTLSLAIFNYVQTGREHEAYMLLSITVMIAFASVWCSEWLLRCPKGM
jgi:molybdate transport system permease protein